MDTYYAKIKRDFSDQRKIRKKLIAILRKQGVSYADIGKRLGITRQRVQQIEGAK